VSSDFHFSGRKVLQDCTATHLDELGVVLGGRGEGDDLTVTDVLEVEKSEHLAADGLVADPEDEVVAPLHGLGYVGQRAKERADALDVHGNEYRPVSI
jgi:hypothetical protein